MTIYLLMFVYISFLAFFSLKYEDKEQELRGSLSTVVG